MGVKKESRGKDKDAYVRWIENTMDEFGLKPSTMADCMGCSVSAISKMQNRMESRTPNFEELYHFSQYSGISMDDIASGIFGSESEGVGGSNQSSARGFEYLKGFSRLPLEDQRLLLDLWEVIRNQKKDRR